MKIRLSPIVRLLISFSMIVVAVIIRRQNYNFIGAREFATFLVVTAIIFPITWRIVQFIKECEKNIQNKR